MKFQKEFSELKENGRVMYSRHVDVFVIDKNRHFEIGKKDGQVTYAKHIKKSIINGRKTRTVTDLLPIEIRQIQWEQERK